MKVLAIILVAISVALAEEVAEKKTEKRGIYGTNYGYGNGGYDGYSAYSQPQLGYNSVPSDLNSYNTGYRYNPAAYVGTGAGAYPASGYTGSTGYTYPRPGYSGLNYDSRYSSLTNGAYYQPQYSGYNTGAYGSYAGNNGYSNQIQYPYQQYSTQYSTNPYYNNRVIGLPYNLQPYQQQYSSNSGYVY